MFQTLVSFSHILGPIIAAVSLIYTVWQIGKKDSAEKLVQYMSLRLADFRENLITELKQVFASTDNLDKQKEIMELQFKLRDERMQNLNDRLGGIDHRTKRNSEYVALLLDVVMPEQKKEILKDQN